MGLQNLLFICCYTKNEGKVSLKGTLAFNILLHPSWFTNPTTPLKILLLSKRHLLLQQTRKTFKSLLLHRLSDSEISGGFIPFGLLFKRTPPSLSPHFA